VSKFDFYILVLVKAFFFSIAELRLIKITASAAARIKSKGIRSDVRSKSIVIYFTVYLINSMKYYAIIVAGGVGSRMNSKLPKQFIDIHKKPIIIHTIEAFYQAFDEMNIIVVMNDEYIDYWQEISQKYLKKQPITVSGGKTRFHSVKNGLSQIQGQNHIIGIHDSVRPCLSVQFIQNIYKKTESAKAVIPLIPLKDSIRKVVSKKGTSATAAVKRSDYLLVQTPQCFEQGILMNAYEQNYSEQFTDDASVVEASGYKIAHIAGEHHNIKITTPDDIKWAKLYLNNNSDTI